MRAQKMVLRREMAVYFLVEPPRVRLRPRVPPELVPNAKISTNQLTQLEDLAAKLFFEENS